MNKKPKNIEQLYSESFNDFRVEPSSGLWKNISTKLAWRNFFSFNPSTLNAWYVAGLLTLATAGVLLLTKPAIETNKNINEITINNPIENTVITTAQDNKTVPKEITTKTNISKSSSSDKVLSNAENQKSESGINDQKLVTPDLELVTRIVSRSEAKVDNPQHVTHISQLATPHPKPKTQNPPSNQQPATSNQSPEPWPNTMDSLFTDLNSTIPEHTIQFPNAFTPNTNGPTNGYYTPGIPNNDVFHPTYKSVVEYHLSIFNRRGELIFESNDINVGWDGYINDRLVAQGVYIWKARGKYSNGENFVKFGNIMLIKK
ncbi:hypothetical protein ES705_28087 [subsurface metagenome]